jgi:AhpD family alkylhydroperoxidase
VKPRLNYQSLAPNGLRLMLEMKTYLQQHSGLEPALMELVDMRASQLNGCAFCLDMHSKDARAAGETEQRLYGLNAWQETPYYTDRERAALAWTEALTNVQQGHVPDEVFEEVKRVFSDEEIAHLTLAVNQINAWNRICIGFRVVPGSYQPAKHPQAVAS